ncbi:MAG: argininosuccinate lyase [Candidatus Omnitrophota bacterium]|nr:MAG: argininosuccinate lyase [Candidatus Omnitrophota bacterium]
MAEKLWGGRFKKQMDADFERFSKSIHYDYQLAEYDLLHTKIHTIALRNSGIFTDQEADKVLKTLDVLLLDIEKDGFKQYMDCEDVHTAIQNRLEEKIGTLVLKLHTLRSRNDQVVFDEKLFCKKKAFYIATLLTGILENLQVLANKYSKQAFPGYTHLQRAQVVRFTDYLQAYYKMFNRDRERLVNFAQKLYTYIGSGALAGTCLKCSDYSQAIKEVLAGTDIEHIGVVDNPLDNVSSRDFIVEFLSILSIAQMHLCRIAEDFILYSTQEFNYFDLPEEFCTGSSLMPHKKNPDFLELVRGHTGIVNGNLISLLTSLKAMPLTYNRDLQLDKPPLFSSIGIIEDELTIMGKFILGIKLNEVVINKALDDQRFYATELAEFLVFKGVAFKDAHNIVGRLIRYAEDEKIKIKDISDEKLKTFHHELNRENVRKIMCSEYAVKTKKSILRNKGQ